MGKNHCVETEKIKERVRFVIGVIVDRRLVGARSMAR